MEIDQMLLQQLESLQKQVQQTEKLLHAARLEKRKSGERSMRFYDYRPLDAIVELLNENKGRMKISDLKAQLSAMGIGIGRKRTEANIRISIDLNVENGNLVRRGEYIELPK